MSDEQTTTGAQPDPKCAECAPASPVTAPVTGHTPLWDHPDLEIPEWLRRKPGETPPAAAGVPRPAQIFNATHASERGDYGIDRYRDYETDQDRAQRAAMLAAEHARVVGTKKEKQAIRTEAQKAEAARMHENKMSARQEFVKHFKWDWEQ